MFDLNSMVYWRDLLTLVIMLFCITRHRSLAELLKFIVDSMTVQLRYLSIRIAELMKTTTESNILSRGPNVTWPVAKQLCVHHTPLSSIMSTGRSEWGPHPERSILKLWVLGQGCCRNSSGPVFNRRKLEHPVQVLRPKPSSNQDGIPSLEWFECLSIPAGITD